MCLGTCFDEICGATALGDKMTRSIVITLSG